MCFGTGSSPFDGHESPPDREPSPARESTDHRNERVLMEADACVQTRANQIRATCGDEASLNSKACEPYRDIMEYIDWLGEDLEGKLSFKTPLYSQVNPGQRVDGITRGSDRIEVDSTRAIDLNGNDRDDWNEHLIFVLIHERLHRYPWKKNGRKMSRSEEEAAIDTVDDDFLNDLNLIGGHFSRCGIDWNLKKL